VYFDPCAHIRFCVCLLLRSGFASGDPVKDTQALTQFAADGHEFAVAQSFSKNFGLYGQRVGCFSLVTGSKEEKTKVESQLKIIARAMYSSPPIHGARIVTTVLGDAGLRAQWEKDVKEMVSNHARQTLLAVHASGSRFSPVSFHFSLFLQADRIILMRKLLRESLEKLGSKHNWEHITNQMSVNTPAGVRCSQAISFSSTHTHRAPLSLALFLSC
jgi:aspartate aminotransferase